MQNLQINLKEPWISTNDNSVQNDSYEPLMTKSNSLPLKVTISKKIY